MELHRCPGCMGTTENAVCEKCGWPLGKNNEIHQLPVGTKLHGQYSVGRVLGQGGFGITYLGWDDHLDIPVAIKEFYPNAMVVRECAVSHTVHCITEQVMPNYITSKERFLREAKALAKLRNVPEVVDIYGFFEENGTAYIIMEYVKGTDLATYISRKGGRLSPEETFRILKPVMAALDKVHQADLVHRDISPDNIMLHPKGGAKLLDFGAVRQVEDAKVGAALDRSTEAILKHGFAPAEQYKARGDLGPWTDEYAMCATVYYCLTGRVPIQAVDRMLEGLEVRFDIPGLPLYQKQALEKGMATRAQDRHGSMKKLMEALFPAEIPASVPVKTEAVPVQVKTEVVPAQMKTEVVPAPAPAPTPNKKLYIAIAAAVILLAIILIIPKNGKGNSGTTDHQISGTNTQVTQHVHSWKAATYDAPETCITCGETRGTKLRPTTPTETQHVHNWKAATYDAPKTCTICGETEGTALQREPVYINEMSWSDKYGKVYYHDNKNAGYDNNNDWRDLYTPGHVQQPVKDGYGKEFTYGLHMDGDQLGPYYITFDVDGKYTTFSGWCVLPDYKANTADASNYGKYFEIYCDGKKVFTSNTMKNGSSSQYFEIDITGVKVLTIQYPAITGPNDLAVLCDGRVS